MPVEIEKKYRIDPELASHLAARLRKSGATFRYEQFEENRIYRGGPLAGRDALIRVRKLGTRAILTYKEALASNDGLKRRVEHETEVGDAEAAEAIIERLGLRLTVVYEKRRKAWQLGEAEVVLDELPFGLFMEVEGDAQSIHDAEDRLGLKDLQAEGRSYPALTMQFGQGRDGVIEARFAAADG
ncbi:MAG: adenylate cyclase [Acidobacteria bacterium OLB17]|nr:MAG: adenylate cyclase [Acidobacteria bacterium OLB17]MCZ2391414.1 class IV adenylate cyclase [Acidobacteriota bacterium]